MTSIPAALRAFASSEPDAPAITDTAGTLSRRELLERADALAHVLAARGVGVGDLVSIGLPSEAGHIVASVATWIVGATPQPVAANMPRAERDAVLELARPAMAIGFDGGDLAPSLLTLPDPDPAAEAREPLPNVTSPNFKAPMSGGSTGRPKLIVATNPAEVESLSLLGQVMRIRPGDTSLITAPLHHNGPLLTSTATLALGGHVVLPGRFDAETSLMLIERHRAGWVYLVPTMMSRIMKLPGEVRQRYDLSSLHTVMHMAAPCPPYLKQAWIDWLGPERIMELYAGTEAQAATFISGTEWLEHRGSVGKPLVGRMQICDPDGNPLPAGKVGEVWMKSESGPTYTYIGAQARRRGDGWESLGDLGWMDADGYLYLNDRLTDMVLVGGSNVYPAEVEAALDEHPAVLSSCVIGLPDDDLGNRLHALVQLGADVADEELSAWCAERLTKYKVPRTFERVDEPLRDDAAKVRRSQLRAERLSTS
ncbi:MAG TPA: AMP-binding protein [Mycobacteriales bacterium]|nr:AMP-binding protein [Mycobacteriales bacterium]